MGVKYIYGPTCASEVLDADAEALGAGQEVVLELGQPFALGHLHADLVLLLREACALAEKQELRDKVQPPMKLSALNMTAPGPQALYISDSQTPTPETLGPTKYPMHHRHNYRYMIHNNVMAITFTPV